jgi:hypothetical protein
MKKIESKNLSKQFFLLPELSLSANELKKIKGGIDVVCSGSNSLKASDFEHLCQDPGTSLRFTCTSTLWALSTNQIYR